MRIGIHNFLLQIIVWIIGTKTINIDKKYKYLLSGYNGKDKPASPMQRIGKDQMIIHIPP